MGMKAKVALGAVAGIVVIGAISATAGNGDKSDGSNGSGKDSSASATHKSGGKKDSGDKKTTEKKKVAFAGDGDYQVGSDVKPGTYRTSGNADDMCYWERAKDASGEMDSLLANDNVSGTSYVTIKATDKVFKSEGCKDWEAVDPKAKGTPASSMDGNGGMYKVGTDIAPGTYKSTGNKDDSCYWERTKDAEHGLNSIIANNNVTGTAVVTIRPSDAYFKTTGCGNWKKTA
ncbi:hypothetical protein LK07_20980 [Streptomyces pluripotens]|uniref:Lipoprotein n=1 Tax=Streptomyces pluripotens TaxID=1355015 RepID=A0A221P1C4_9ACTN|nr:MULTISPECIES: hypothetical protein [Streptomyces]ARP71823.1 hypothetical protein LK06_019820 [Streptomyces pluripotens]ASN26073.1 hypothetical protein LK07_20980 [Streptomyces pluripotens]KIE26237.1 hypothetical protein LK08_13525 [Streptomyces sp. MUSC 125]MCH0556299.1 hypothetical protein [Streptomyces sp. MUM 16J]